MVLNHVCFVPSGSFYDCWVVVPYVVLWQFALVLFCGVEYEIYDKGLLKNGITAVFLI